MKIKCLLLLGAALLLSAGCYTVPDEKIRELESAAQLHGASGVVMDAMEAASAR